MLLRTILSVVAAVCVFSLSHGQEKIALYFSENGMTETRNALFDSKQQAYLHVEKKYAELLAEGYIDARIDTSGNDSSLTAFITKGPLYVIRSCRVLADSTGKIFYQNSWRKNHALTEVELLNQAQRTLTELENNGYPFATIVPTAIKFDGPHQAQITFTLTTGPLVVLDSIIVSGNQQIPKHFLISYTGLKKGEPYNESLIAGLQKKLSEITFLKLKRAPEVRFRQGKYDLYIYPERKRANTFNGILGLRPNETTGKTTITGDAEIKLLNAINTGEEFYLNWRKLQPQTQDLMARISLPYLFRTPLGTDAEMKIYKRDSTFSSVRGRLALVLLFGGSTKLKLFAEKNNSTNHLQSNVLTGALASVNTTYYGMQWQREKLDYRLNPRKGYSIATEVATGTRKFLQGNFFSETGADKISKNIHKAEFSTEVYLPTWKAQCIRLSAQGATMSAASIFENEAFRTGGLRTIRGINEENIFATSWSVASIEYRLLFEENSALYLFADQAWYEKKVVNQFITDTPLGFGAGLNFETGAGIFTFNYALGSQFDQPILLRNAKLSFGFRSLF